MRRSLIYSIGFVAAIIMVLPFGVRAAEPVGRYCNIQLSVRGVNDETVNLLNNQSAEKQLQYLLNNQEEAFCALSDPKKKSPYVGGGIIYEFGKKINIDRVYNYYGNVRRKSVEDDPPGFFFEGNVLKQLRDDGSESICHPIPYNLAIKFAQAQGTTILPSSEISKPVTREGCPEFEEVNFAKEVLPNRIYFLVVSISTGDFYYGGDFQDKLKTQEDSDYLKNLTKSLNLLKAKDIPQLIGIMIRIAMGVIGTIALVVVIVAGITWMTAAGNSGREERAKDMLFWGALGVIVILSSYSILTFVLENAF